MIIRLRFVANHIKYSINSRVVQILQRHTSKLRHAGLDTIEAAKAREKLDVTEKR